ncbi:MAG: enoyl-CoA hydratase-related protein [Rubrivivax sp.]
MSFTPSIDLDMQGALALMTFSQPARGNPIDGDFTRDFKAVAAELWDRRQAGTLRAVLMRAAGPNFSYGGDLKSFHPVRDRLGPLVRGWTADLHVGLQRFWSLPVPVVCAVQGFAMGGGVGVLAGADVVLAAEGARFGSAFAQLGFSCDSAQRHDQRAHGRARARRFMLLAEVLSAAEAQQAGLVDRVVPDDQLAAESLALAQKLAAGPTVAYGEIKRLFMAAGGGLLAAQLEDEAMTLARVAASADAQEGIAATVERRKPSFQGR